MLGGALCVPCAAVLLLEATGGYRRFGYGTAIVCNFPTIFHNFPAVFRSLIGRSLTAIPPPPPPANRHSHSALMAQPPPPRPLFRAPGSNRKFLRGNNRITPTLEEQTFWAVSGPPTVGCQTPPPPVLDSPHAPSPPLLPPPQGASATRQGVRRQVPNASTPPPRRAASPCLTDAARPDVL